MNEVDLRLEVSVFDAKGSHARVQPRGKSHGRDCKRPGIESFTWSISRGTFGACPLGVEPRFAPDIGLTPSLRNLQAL
eukprot:3919210-Amphidinium_carterae.1